MRRTSYTRCTQSDTTDTRFVIWKHWFRWCKSSHPGQCPGLCPAVHSLSLPQRHPSRPLSLPQLDSAALDLEWALFLIPEGLGLDGSEQRLKGWKQFYNYEPRLTDRKRCHKKQFPTKFGLGTHRPIRMTEIQNTDRSKCCWECKMVRPCWKAVWQFLAKLNILLCFCCFCCGHPCTMLGVSLFISCKNKIQCVCVKKKAKLNILLKTGIINS